MTQYHCLYLNLYHRLSLYSTVCLWFCITICPWLYMSLSVSDCVPLSVSDYVPLSVSDCVPLAVSDSVSLSVPDSVSITVCPWLYITVYRCLSGSVSPFVLHTYVSLSATGSLPKSLSFCTIHMFLSTLAYLSLLMYLPRTLLSVSQSSVSLFVSLCLYIVWYLCLFNSVKVSVFSVCLPVLILCTVSLSINLSFQV